MSILDSVDENVLKWFRNVEIITWELAQYGESALEVEKEEKGNIGGMVK